MPGILDVNGELATGKLVVRYDPARVKPEQIVKAIEVLNYRVVATYTP